MKPLLVLIVFGVATYLLVRAMQQRGVVISKRRPPSRTQSRTQTRPGQARPTVVAPDDDEDFLRDLDRRRLNPEDPGTGTDA